VFAVDTIECLGGRLPKAQLCLVEAWADSPLVAPVTQSGLGNTQHREPRVAHLRPEQPAGGSLPVRAGAEWGARGLTSDCARRGAGDPADPEMEENHLGNVDPAPLNARRASHLRG
jgi:hypothetical protein